MSDDTSAKKSGGASGGDREKPGPARMTHDAFFKKTFSHSELAVPFFQGRMPAGLAARVEWDSLRLLEKSFVKPEFDQLHSDLYFSVLLAGREARIHLLLEHQSTPAPDMPLRVLEYIAAALRHEYDRAGGKGPLPVVIPFLLNQGPRRWNQPLSLLEYYDLPAELAKLLLPYIPAIPLHFHDLAAADPAEEERNQALRIVLQEMKLVRDGRGMLFIDWISGQSVPPAVLALVEWLARYLLTNDSGLDIRRIREKLEANPELKNGIMTTAEKLFNEGIQKGIEKGELIGHIRSLEEFLGRRPSPREALQAMDIGAMETQLARLQTEYDQRFKGG